MKSVNVWSEFQPLKRVILGAPFPPQTFDWHNDEETKKVMRQIFEETSEDLATNAIVNNVYERLRNEEQGEEV